MGPQRCRLAMRAVAVVGEKESEEATRDQKPGENRAKRKRGTQEGSK